VNVCLGGFTRKNKAQDIIFGYDDNLLKMLRDLDTFIGGDPTILIKVGFMDNKTYEDTVNQQSLYTGSFKLS
jgi:hypothetical protein